MSTSDQRRWDVKVKEHRCKVYNVNKTTTKTPYEALHGYLPRFQSGTLPALSRTRNKSNSPKEVQAEVRVKIVHEQKKMKDQYDRKHFDDIRYEVGEVVVMLRQPTAGQPSKLQAKYREKPLQVMKVLPSDTYRVAELGSDGNEIYATTAHVSQLKSWRIVRDADDENNEEANDESDDEVQPDATNREQRDPTVTTPMPTTVETIDKYNIIWLL